MGSVAIQNESKHCKLLVSVRVNVSSWEFLNFQVEGQRNDPEVLSSGGGPALCGALGLLGHTKDYPPLSPAWHTSPIDVVLLK